MFDRVFNRKNENTYEDLYRHTEYDDNLVETAVALYFYDTYEQGKGECGRNLGSRFQRSTGCTDSPD